jgi:hypothetical protein
MFVGQSRLTCGIASMHFFVCLFGWLLIDIVFPDLSRIWMLCQLDFVLALLILDRIWTPLHPFVSKSRLSSGDLFHD